MMVVVCGMCTLVSVSRLYLRFLQQLPFMWLHAHANDKAYRVLELRA